MPVASGLEVGEVAEALRGLGRRLLKLPVPVGLEIQVGEVSEAIRDLVGSWLDPAVPIGRMEPSGGSLKPHWIHGNHHIQDSMGLAKTVDTGIVLGVRCA